MAAHLIIWATLVLSMACFGDAAESVITITPSSSISLTGNETGRLVEVTCRPPAGAVLVTSMKIRRIVKNQEQNLASAVISDTNPGAGGPAIKEPGANVAGSSVSGSTGEKFITFTMPQTACNDAGMYVCDTTHISGTAAVTGTSSANLTVDMSPGQITLTAEPSSALYQVNESLSLRCNGPVGTVPDSSQVRWMWEYRDSGNVFNWLSAVTQDNTISDEPKTGVGTCQEYWVSVLRRQVTVEDEGREYRCYITKNSVDYPQYAGTFKIMFVKAPGENNQADTGANTDNNSGTSKAQVGGIVGGVIGGLIVIAIIIVLVYFLVIRKRREKGETYNPENNKPADEATPYPAYPTSNADVSYTKSNRFRDRENGWGEGGRTKTQDGLHYADLDLVRTDDSASSVTTSSRNQPTEYASIRLF